jgi:hypothetical protein
MHPEESASAQPTASPDSSNNNDEEKNAEKDAKETSDGPAEPKETNLNTAGITRTGTATETGNRNNGNATTTRPPKKTEFDPREPAGGVSMITPALTDGYQLYKIGDYVTWGWNYTSLQGKPTAIDVYVKCSRVPKPFTLTQNMTFEEPASFTWDTHAYETNTVGNPLLTEQYTLVIADADTGISATPEAGYLAPYTGFTFGLYERRKTENTGDGWQCASCSGVAGAGVDGRAVGVAVAMSAVTVMSFTWFVAGFGGFL